MARNCLFGLLDFGLRGRRVVEYTTFICGIEFKDKEEFFALFTLHPSKALLNLFCYASLLNINAGCW